MTGIQFIKEFEMVYVPHVPLLPQLDCFTVVCALLRFACCVRVVGRLDGVHQVPRVYHASSSAWRFTSTHCGNTRP